MTIDGEYKAPVSKAVEMLRAELGAGIRGGRALVARIALACTSVMLLAVQSFESPARSLGVSFPILISRESPGAARKSAFQIAMACSIATLVVILGGVFTSRLPISSCDVGDCKSYRPHLWCSAA